MVKGREAPSVSTLPLIDPLGQACIRYAEAVKKSSRAEGMSPEEHRHITSEAFLDVVELSSEVANHSGLITDPALDWVPVARDVFRSVVDGSKHGVGFAPLLSVDVSAERQAVQRHMYGSMQNRKAVRHILAGLTDA